MDCQILLAGKTKEEELLDKYDLQHLLEGLLFHKLQKEDAKHHH